MEKKNLTVFAIVIVLAVVIGINFFPRSTNKTGFAPDTAVLLLDSETIDDTLANGRPTMVEFGRGGCAACLHMVPVLEQAALDYQSKVDIVSINLDDSPSLSQRFQIAVTPTEIFFDATGKEVNRMLGFLPTEELATRLDALSSTDE